MPVHWKSLYQSVFPLASRWRFLTQHTHTNMKTKLQLLIAKFLGVDSTIEAKCEEVRKDYSKAIEEISDEVNNRLCDVEDCPSKVEELESQVSDLESKVEDIESGEYVSADWVTDEIESAKSDLSDEITEKVAEAFEEASFEVSKDKVKEIIEEVLTKELILKILAK